MFEWVHPSEDYLNKLTPYFFQYQIFVDESTKLKFWIKIRRFQQSEMTINRRVSLSQQMMKNINGSSFVREDILGVFLSFCACQ